jgi:hypothetical protein
MMGWIERMFDTAKLVSQLRATERALDEARVHIGLLEERLANRDAGVGTILTYKGGEPVMPGDRFIYGLWLSDPLLAVVDRQEGDKVVAVYPDGMESLFSQMDLRLCKLVHRGKADG